MRHRLSKLIVSILLVFSAISIAGTAYQYWVPVQAAPSISVSPGSGVRGSIVTITGSGFSLVAGGCTLSDSPLPTIITLGSCTNSASGTATASFTVAAGAAPGVHVITLTGTVVTEVASAVFTVLGPTITVNPTFGPVSTAVTITGSGFDTADSCGTVIAPVSTPSDIVTGSFVCSTFSAGTILASFTVDPSASPGVYTIPIDGGGTVPDTASASFTVISPSPTITLIPTSGFGSATVTVSGSGFNPSDVGAFLGCITSTPLPDIVASSSCQFTAGGVFTGSFTITASPALGAHAILVTGTSGDIAAATFTVTSPTPTITLTPSSGPVSTAVTISGSGFSPADAGACVLGDIPLPTIITLGTCTISASGIVIASFTVSNPAALGVHSIKVTGSSSDFATASFTVTSPAAKITLNPNSGARGVSVTISGSGFNPADAGACVLSDTPLPTIITLGSCTISAGGAVSASFTVSAAAAFGAHLITVTGSTGDLASATFTVTSPTPTITLVPNSGPIGTAVTVTGSGFNAADGPGPCASMTSSPTNIIAGGSSCTFNGLGQLTAPSNFVVISTAVPGTYVITVQGSTGDSAQAVFTVTGVGPTITLSPNAAPTGTIVTVSGSGFNPTDTCTGASITGPAVSAASCSMSAGKITAASFTVTGSGTSIVTVTGSTGDFAQALFTVTSAGSGFLTILPSSGPRGITISISGQLPANKGTYSTCSISGTPVTKQFCQINGLTSATITTTTTTIAGFTASFSGSFVVGNVNPGSFTITVTGSGSGLSTPRSVSGTFTITPPTISLTPVSGGIGITVSISGSGYSPADTTCSLSGSSSVIKNGQCSVSSGTVSGSFVVNNVSPGAYLISVTGNQGDKAQATFTVVSGPSIVLNPSIGTPGTVVSVTGSGFLPQDSTCTISGTGVQNAACSVVIGSGAPAGSFTIANVAPGSYTIKLSASNGGDSAQAVLTVTSPFVATIILSPSDGPTGTSVSVTGTGFKSIDTSCQLTSSDPLLVLSPTCSVSGGKVTGHFTVGGGAIQGSKTVTVTGDKGDSASVAFTVDATPVLVFSLTQLGSPVSSVAPGATVFVRLGSGQLSSSSISCSITSSPGGLFESSVCHIANAGSDLTGTFFMAAANPSGNTYSITVQGSYGDKAVGTISIVFAPSLTLTPTYGSPGDTVSFTGRGLLSADTACTVTSNPSASTNGAQLQTGETCSVSGGTATGTFVINSLATADGSPWTVTVTGNPGVDAVKAQFTVVPVITVTPTNGVFGAVVAVSGNGFSSKGTSCSLTPTPSSLFATGTAGCNYIVPGPNSNGQISGTFTVATGIPAGTYVVTASDGVNSASATFTVGTPTAEVTVNPSAIAPPLSGTVAVAVTGFGFNGADTGCTVTVSSPIAVSGTCIMSGGNAGATLLVPALTPAGLYLVTVTGTPYGDFASNYFAVITVTTMTSTTSTTSVSTTQTSTTTLTTSTSISSSLTTTTVTSTGGTTIVFTQGTQTTVSGITTSTVISIGYTSFPTTQQTTTTQTVTLGQIMRPGVDEVGMFGMLLVLVAVLWRRVF